MGCIAGIAGAIAWGIIFHSLDLPRWQAVVVIVATPIFWFALAAEEQRVERRIAVLESRIGELERALRQRE